MSDVEILVGIPGSGKSRYARSLDLPVSVFSADHHFMRSGAYEFRPSELGVAHAACMRSFVEAVRGSGGVVVVDNTNTTALEIAPYYAVATAFGCPVTIRIFRCEPSVGAARNLHGVSLATCTRMAAAVAELKLPPYWNARVIFMEES